MTTFQSSTIINRPAEEVYNFLADMNNHQQLMATDDISLWSSTNDKASFTMRGIIRLTIAIEERVPASQIRIKGVDKPPIEIELLWSLTTLNQGTKVDYTLSAELNFMMKMVASGPLQKLVDEEIANLTKLLN